MFVVVKILCFLEVLGYDYGLCCLKLRGCYFGRRQLFGSFGTISLKKSSNSTDKHVLVPSNSSESIPHNGTICLIGSYGWI